MFVTENNNSQYNCPSAQSFIARVRGSRGRGDGSQVTHNLAVERGLRKRRHTIPRPRCPAPRAQLLDLMRSPATRPHIHENLPLTRGFAHTCSRAGSHTNRAVWESIRRKYMFKAWETLCAQKKCLLFYICDGSNWKQTKGPITGRGFSPSRRGL